MILSPLKLGILAAVYNFNLLVFNVGFTNSHAIHELDANMWSPFGQLMVLVWGIVFAATGFATAEGNEGRDSSSIYFVWYSFVVEKIVYVIGWIYWHSNHSAFQLINEASNSGSIQDILAPLFHCIYGAGDFIFAILFWKMGSQLQLQHQQQQQKKQK